MEDRKLVLEACVEFAGQGQQDRTWTKHAQASVSQRKLGLQVSDLLIQGSAVAAGLPPQSSRHH